MRVGLGLFKRSRRVEWGGRLDGKLVLGCRAVGC